MRLCVTAALFPAADHATKENNYIKNLVGDREEIENTYEYSTRIQDKHIVNIWFYQPSTEDDTKVEILQKCSNFFKGRNNVRILAWDEQGDLIKNIEVLTQRLNIKHAMYWVCDNCSLWFATQQKFETHECCTQTKPMIICPKLKEIKFKKHQHEVKNVINSDIECYMNNINKKIGDNTYKISDHAPIAVGFSCVRASLVTPTKGETPNNGNYKSYFGPDFIKGYVKDLLEIETENNFKLNNPMIFNKKR